MKFWHNLQRSVAFALALAATGSAWAGELANEINNAKENATITLTSAVTEDDAIVIDKNLTIDFGGKAAILNGGIVINEDKALTVTRANASGNVIPTITGGGNLVVSGNNTFAWRGMAGTSALASITQNDSGSGGIAITGHGTINVTGDVNVRAALTFSPSSAEAAYVSDGFTIKMAANSVSAGMLNGGATIETEEGTTVGGGTFYGVVKGGLAASGNFVSQGAGLDGTIAVADGRALTIGNRLASMSNIRFHLDATDSATYTLEDETSNLTQIKGGDYTYSLVGGSTAAVLSSGDENHFGGKPYFQFDGSKYAYGGKVSARSYIAVTHPDSLGGYLAYYASDINKDKFGVDSTTWFARCYGNNCDGWLTQNGTIDRTAIADADTIISLLTRITASDNRPDTLGAEYVGAIAEFVGFYSAISVEDRVACEMYLMDKWDLAASANFRPFASTAEVELDTGSTLDLGGYTQSVKSLSGSGRVQNGILNVTDAISVPAGNTLVIPYGSTYMLANDGTYAVADSVAGTVTITHRAADIDGTPYDTVQGAILAYTEGMLTIYESATDVDLGTADVTVSAVVLADGVSAPTFAANPQYSASYSGGTISNVRNAKTYAWTLGGVDTAWSTLGNWRINDGADVPVLPPAAGDTISFGASATVTNVPASATISAIAMGSAIGTVTITGEPLIISSAISMTAGNALVVPYGSSYTLASDGTVAVEDSTAGTVTIRYPAATITVNEAVIGYATVGEAILAYTSGTLTIYESATDVDLGTADVTVSAVVLADGVSAPTFTANPQYSASYSEGRISNVRNAKTYAWTGEVDTAWSTLSNWRINDGADVPVLPPAADDTISFGAAATVTNVPASATISAIAMGSAIGTVTITGAPLTISTAISVSVGNTLVIPYGSTYTLASGTGAMEDESVGTITFKHKAATIAVTDSDSGATTTTVYDTVKGAILAYTEGTLTIYENATDIDLGENEIDIAGIVRDEGVSEPTFATSLPWETTYIDGRLIHTRPARTYVWNGSVDTSWNTLGNWTIGAITPALLPSKNDSVQFLASEEEGFTGWTVALTSVQSVNTLTVNAPLALSGNYVQPRTVDGTGVITLGDDAGFKAYDASYTMTIANALNITASSDKPAKIVTTWHTSSAGTNVELNGNLTGTGEIQIDGERINCKLGGDNREFAGTIYVVDDGNPRNATYVNTANASSSNAVWKVYNSSKRNFTPDGSTCYFGELSGTFYRAVASNWSHVSTDVIGARNTDFALDGQFGTASDRSDRIIKVGTGTMTFSGKNVKSYEIQDGKIFFTKDQTEPYEYIKFTGGEISFSDAVTYDPSAKILNSTSAIVFDDGGENRTWVTALAASNTGGLTKKGSGTLTLEAAPLAANFTITVMEGGGRVLVPRSAAANCKNGENTKVVKYDTNYYAFMYGTDTIETSDTSKTVYADNQTEATFQANAYVVNLTSEQVDQGLKESYYKVVATNTEGTTYALSVELDPDEVSPTFAGEGHVINASDATVTLNVDRSSLKPGLYYGIGTRTSVDGTVTHDNSVLYDGTNASELDFTAQMPETGVLYYVIEASDTALMPSTP